jgi:transmembrane sensor
VNASNQEEAPQVSANEVDLRAANWLQCRHFWDWTEEDQVALDAWLAKSESHRIAYWRQSAGWNRTERLVVLRSPKSEKRDVRPRRRPTPNFVRVTAALIVVSALGVVSTRQILGSSETIYETSVGEHRTIVLADGSRIELNTSTILRVNVSPTGGRKVWLEKGEAYFQIKHDAVRPFVVMAANHRITDLGTKFLVRRDADRLEVALSEGKVRLESTGTGAQARSSLMTPGDVVIATADAMSVTKKSTKKLANELGWRRGVLVFDRTSLADAAAELNRYNREQLVIDDSFVARRLIGGTFPTNNIELFARVARDLLGLHVERRGEETVISR